MNTTNQLPEPELGYIQTDKSNQPAFSARQMREAMQARFQVQGEPVAWCIEAQVDGEWFVQYPIAFTKQGAELDASSYVTGTVLRIRPLAFGDTTSQSVQATQAEVTDAAIDAATRHIYHNGRPASKEYRVGIARAILALRPQAVPMTDEQIRSMCKQGWVFETVRQWVHVVEAHHGITAKEKVVRDAS